MRAGLAVVVGRAVAPLAGAELPGAQADHGVPLARCRARGSACLQSYPCAAGRGRPAEPLDLGGGGQDAGRVELHRVPGRVPAGRQQRLRLGVEVVDRGHQLGPGRGQLRAGGVRRGRGLPRSAQEQLDPGREHRAPLQRVGDAAHRADRDGRVGAGRGARLGAAGQPAPAPRWPVPVRPGPAVGAGRAAAGQQPDQRGRRASGRPPAPAVTGSRSPRSGPARRRRRRRSPGNRGSISCRVSASRLAMAQFRYHLRSAGITYQGAASVSHSRSASV